MLIVLTGSSGSGKNTIINEIEKDSQKFKYMPTFTTRDKRPNEIEGRPYFYLSKDEFQNKIKQNEFIEYEYIHNNYYGSSKVILEEFLGQDKVIIKDFGIEGAQNISSKLNDLTPVVKVFLTTNKKELKKRLKNRGEQQIKLRLKRYKKEQKEMYKFDYLIYNNDLLTTKNFILNLINFEITDFLPSKNIDKLKLKKVNKYVNQLISGKILKPIEISYNNNKLQIVSGDEKFIASLIANRPVCKKLVDKTIDSNFEPNMLMEWKSFIRECTSNIN